MGSPSLSLRYRNELGRCRAADGRSMHSAPALSRLRDAAFPAMYRGPLPPCGVVGGASAEMLRGGTRQQFQYAGLHVTSYQAPSRIGPSVLGTKRIHHERPYTPLLRN